MNEVWSKEEIEQALHVVETRRRKDSFDPTNPGSKPTRDQRKALEAIGQPEAKFRILRCANQSGKSTTVAWELAKVITGTHPWWKRPDAWGEGPIKAIVAGQDRKMMELELWEGKLLHYLVRDEWHVVRSGNSLSHVTHRPTGNQIIFLSHSDGSDKARRHMQGYVVNYLWIDEMPISARIWEELEKRIIAKDGYLVASFTSKVRAESTRRIVENHSAQNYCSTYRFKMLDNPALQDRKEEILQQMAGYPESYRNAILYGDWYTGDSAVYFWEESMVCDLPEDYSNTWRHLEACDPAMQSKMGHLILAEHPNTGTWWMVQSSYIKNLDSPKAYVEEALKKTATKNIKVRVSDVATWYTSTAFSDFGVSYQTPFNKTQRKDELIKNLQAALSSGKLKIDSRCVDFINEISTCQWSETASGRIINSQSYHCLDAAQYAIDCLPPWKGPEQLHEDYHVNIKMKHRKNQVDRAKKAALSQKMGKIRRPLNRWNKRKTTNKRRLGVHGA